MAPLGRNVGVPRRGMRPAGRSQRAGATDGSSGCQGCKEKVRRTASVGRGGGVLSYSGSGDECSDWTEDRVQRSRRGCPVVVADVPVPTEAGVTFSAVAEVHISTAKIDDDIFAVQASEQRTVCSTDPGRVPKVVSVPAGDTLVAEPLKHSVQISDLISKARPKNVPGSGSEGA